MKKFPQFLTILLCCLLLIGVMAACSKSSSKTSSKVEMPPGAVMGPNGKPIKEEIIIGIQSDPVSLDPHFGTENASRRHTNMIFERLVFFNASTGKVEPAIAQSWDINGKEFTFHLRKDIKFHNGKQLTAADVKYSLDRMKTMPRAATYVVNVDKVEIVNDYTVKVTLKSPSPVFLNNLSIMIAAIIPEGSGDTIAKNPIGCGPYKFVEWKQDDFIVYERFNDFFGGAKPSPRIRFRTIPDNAARLLALEAGDIDLCYGVHLADYTMLENRSDIILYKTSTTNLEYMAFETTKPPFNNVHARRAVAHAINKDAYIKGIFRGEYLNLHSILLPGDPAYRKVDYAEYNPAMAKEELAKAGSPNGFSFTVASTAARSNYIEPIQYDLAQVGIKMTFDIVSNVPSYAAGAYSGAIITSTSMPELDGGVLSEFLHSKGGSNQSRYSNPRVDKLFDAANVEMDPTKRAAMLGEISEIIAAEVPIHPMHALVYIDGANSHVKGVEVHSSSICYYYNIYYEYD